jgi:RNA polymerase sigma-70 factor (ECF subfamily)
VVLAAREQENAYASTALEKLCHTYWPPLYAFIRRDGCQKADAEDLTQEFLAWLLESKHLQGVDPQLGKFRSFLLVRLKHFLSDERKKARAQKRGGGQTILSLDADLAEQTYTLESKTELPPELVFDRHWALTVMKQTTSRLRAEYVAADRTELFEELRHFQPGEDGRPYSEVAARLGLTEGAMKSAVHRFRQRHRDLLRDEIAQTVAAPAEIDSEIRYLISVLAGNATRESSNNEG